MSKNNATAAREDESLMRRYLKKIEKMTVGELQDEYEALTGDPNKSRNKPWLKRKVLALAQEQAEGGLSKCARKRLQLLLGVVEESRTANPPKPRPRQAGPKKAAATSTRDPRLPEAGTTLTREFKGKSYTVTVEADHFNYDGETFTSLSTIARRITGGAWNGFTFFKLASAKKAS